MDNPDFWDFILEGGWDLLFHEDEEGGTGPRCPRKAPEKARKRGENKGVNMSTIFHKFFKTKKH